MDSSSTPAFFSVMNAVYSVGVGTSAPTFGWLANKVNAFSQLKYQVSNQNPEEKRGFEKSANSLLKNYSELQNVKKYFPGKK